MTTTRTPHVSQHDTDTPENRRLQPDSADAPFFDKSGIVRSLVWGSCLNISSSGFIIIGLSGSAEAELVKNYMDLCTLLYQTCAVLFFAGQYNAAADTREKHDTTYCAVVRASDGAYWLRRHLSIPAGQRGDFL